jgi:phosphoglycolate phosphatase-like HAD superfamily hydrolase
MRTLIFDFDGTIADSFEVLCEVFEEVTKRAHPFTEAEIASLRALPARDVLKSLKIHSWQFPRLVMRGKRKLHDRIGELNTFSGLAEELSRLHEAGYEMYILSSNSKPNIELFLANHHLSRFFKDIYGNVGVFSKAAAIKKLLRAERLDPGECIYIGDEVRDVEAAKKLNLSHVAVAWGFNTLEALKQADPQVIAANTRELDKAVRSHS